MKPKVFNYMKNGTKMILLILVLSSCVNLKKVRLLQEKSITDISSEFINKHSSNYKVKVGDHLYIKIYSVDPKTSKFFQSDFPSLMNPTYLYLNSYKVNADGYISFSFVEKMFVKGLTIEEVREVIQNTLNQYFKDATVFVKLVNFQVSVLGEVGAPGTYTVDQEEITLFQALGLAGGIKEFGNVRKAILVRQTLNGSKVEYLDLTDNAILQSEYYYLMPDDVIYIEPRGSKPFAFREFPYSMIFSILSLGIAGYIFATEKL